MIISSKDGIKLFGISIVCCCAVFVCTFMLNFYLDVVPLRASVPEGLEALYDAQLATAQFSAAITGGVLALTAVVMLIFYLRLYIETHAVQLGVLKAIGYSRGKIAVRFWVFGLSVLLGCLVGYALGWAFMQFVYDGLTIEGMGAIKPTFHIGLTLALVMLPALFFSLLACAYPYFALRRPVQELLRGKESVAKTKNKASEKDRTFLREMRVSVVKSKKLLAFFIAFSCFCFSAMIQMGMSMEELTSASMGYMILIIGLVLALVTAFMAITSLLHTNAKNLSLMKAFGYTLKECALCVLGGYLPFVFLGFALGTVYQYGLLTFMVNVIFANVGEVPAYNFNVSAFIVTLALFLVSYATFAVVYIFKMNKISLKEIMLAE